MKSQNLSALLSCYPNVSLQLPYGELKDHLLSVLSAHVFEDVTFFSDSVLEPSSEEPCFSLDTPLHSHSAGEAQTSPGAQC